MTRHQLSPVAANIACPTLLTVAERNPVGAGAPKLLEAISSKRRALLEGTEAQGTGGHCEATGRRPFHQRCYDWLDETLAML